MAYDALVELLSECDREIAHWSRLKEEISDILSKVGVTAPAAITPPLPLTPPSTPQAYYPLGYQTGYQTGYPRYK